MNAIDAKNLGLLTDDHESLSRQPLAEGWDIDDLFGYIFEKNEIAEGATVPGFTWPAAVPIRPANWNLDRQDYQLAPGDTLSGLAATYLGTPQRWREIWDVQPQSFRWSRKPDQLYAGEWILMPDDAVATLLAALGVEPKKGTPAKPPPGGYPVQPGQPGASPAAAATSAGKNSALPWIAAGAIGFVALYAMGGKRARK